MEKAIKRAIEGGWNDRLYQVDSGNKGVWTHQDSLLLDPLFWQALGKAEGWAEKCIVCNSIANGLCENHHYTTWKTKWHRLIDHLASGKDAESFFSELLK